MKCNDFLAINLNLLHLHLASFENCKFADSPGYLKETPNCVSQAMSVRKIFHSGFTRITCSRSADRSCIFLGSFPDFKIQAFRYFSQHCCAWKHIASLFLYFLTRDSLSIVRKSPSAFLIHSFSRGFIEEFTLGNYAFHERVAHGNPF